MLIFNILTLVDIFITYITNNRTVIDLPYGFIRDHTITPTNQQSPFILRATLFQDFVIRIVRFAFAKLPSDIGRVFFSKAVALPFLRFRLLRHGHLTGDVKWREVKRSTGLEGIWIAGNPDEKPDVVMMYIHGMPFIVIVM